MIQQQIRSPFQSTKNLFNSNLSLVTTGSSNINNGNLDNDSSRISKPSFNNPIGNTNDNNNDNTFVNDSLFNNNFDFTSIRSW